MDGTVLVDLVKLDNPIRRRRRARVGRGRRRAGREDDGPHHRGPRPHGAAARHTRYRFTSEQPGVILLQTILGPDTVERWAEICLT